MKRLRIPFILAVGVAAAFLVNKTNMFANVLNEWLRPVSPPYLTTLDIRH